MRSGKKNHYALGFLEHYLDRKVGIDMIEINEEKLKAAKRLLIQKTITENETGKYFGSPVDEIDEFMSCFDMQSTVLWENHDITIWAYIDDRFFIFSPSYDGIYPTASICLAMALEIENAIRDYNEHGSYKSLNIIGAVGE